MASPPASPAVVIKDTEGAMEESLQALAGRLANAVQVISAWADALGEDADKSALRARLGRAAGQLDRAVNTLSGETAPVAVEAGGGAQPGWMSSPAVNATVASSDRGALGLRGRSEMISLVEFLSFLANLGKGGVLQVQTAAENFLLQFENGHVVFATGNNPPGLRLREILVADGALTAAELDRVLAERGEEELLGKAVRRLGLVDEDVLREALTWQITQMFTRMHLVGTGFDFQFEEGKRVFVEPDLRLKVSHLLLESARLKDEELCRREPQVCELGEQELDDLVEKVLEEVAPAIRGADESEGESGIVPFRRRIRARLDGDRLTLPSLPDTTGKVLAICGREDVDSDELWRCVGRDQALCAHLLRIANSAAHAPVQPIESVRVAITRLGAAKIREVALAMALDQKVFRLSSWRTLVRSLWRTAAISGGFGALLGRRCLRSAAHGSLLGLLSDIGKPVVLGLIGEIEKEVGQKLDRDAAELLMEEFHEEAGVRLARQWDLPEWVVGVIEFHHRYEAAGDRQREAMLGNLASELALWAQEPSDRDTARLESLPARARLGLSLEDFREMLGQRAAVLDAARAYA